MHNNPESPKFAAIITAAGSSFRMGTGRKKEFESIDGQPVLHHAAAAFLKCKHVGELIVTFGPGAENETRDAVAGLPTDAAISFVEGGETRQESVYRGLLQLEQLNPAFVLIHDGSRPWITPDLIHRVIAGTAAMGSCVPLVPSIDALKRVDKQGLIFEHVQKTEYLRAQTPQGFRYSDIIRAHREARVSGQVYSDDAEAYAKTIGAVFSISGDPENRKITYRYDLK